MATMDRHLFMSKGPKFTMEEGGRGDDSITVVYNRSFTEENKEIVFTDKMSDSCSYDVHFEMDF